tara:strand:- start:168 stop:620 length:453 start_codon:yes stop_codon:yes gene_type:complete
MRNTSKNEQMNTTLKRVKLRTTDLHTIQTCLEDSIRKEPNKFHEKTLKKVNALLEFEQQNLDKMIIDCILFKNIWDLTLWDIATVLDINDRKSNNIFGLDYYYADGMIGAYVPNSNDMRYSWKNAQAFMNCHGMKRTDDLQEFNPREYMK